MKKLIIFFTIIISIIIIALIISCLLKSSFKNISQLNELITEDGIVNYLYNNNKCIFNTRKISNYKNFIKNDNYYTNIYICLTGNYKNIHNILPEILKNIKSCTIITLEADIIDVPQKILEDKRIIHWFTWNKPYNHSKLSSLPIGLNYDRHYKSLKMVRDNISSKYIHKKYLVGLSYGSNNKQSERVKLLNYVKNSNLKYNFIQNIPYKKSYEIITKHTGYPLKVDVSDEKIYKQMLSYKFIFSPKGLGEDCHRTWECLYLGIIPIIKSSPLDDIYNDLPVLIVKDFELVTNDMLNKFYEDSKLKKYNYNKLYLDFWIKKILNE